MRLMDADALDKLLNDCMGRYKFIPEPIGIIRSDEINAIRNLIKEQMPTVDAVPVVRCSECKHYKSVLCPLIMADGYYWPAHNPDFFCADGERREEDD